MADTFPIAFVWNGEAMAPTPRFRRACDERFVVGLIYTLDEIAGGSTKSRNHYFACLAEAWKNLPEDEAERHPTSEHLRHFALIKTGYANSQQTVYGSKADALRAAAMARSLTEYALVLVSENVVTVWTAKSQSPRAMSPKEFQESKTAVLDYVSALCGVNTDDLKNNAGKAA